jgi:Tfp pilus assembly pilus retraction ATPase PilT
MNLGQFKNAIPDVDRLLVFCTENNCSDLYIKVNEQPKIARYGLIYTVPSFEMTFKVWDEWAQKAISYEQHTKYVRQKMLDFSYVIPVNKNGHQERLRYRVSAGFSMGKNVATFRMISMELPSFHTINFPEQIAKRMECNARKRNGITMICGATGSGKSVLDKQVVHIRRKIKGNNES